MRTAKEIRQYLKMQKWYKDYVRNVKNERSLQKKDKKAILRGYNKYATISGAFFWNNTYQGLVFWAKVDEKFLKWYSKGRIQ